MKLFIMALIIYLLSLALQIWSLSNEKILYREQCLRDDASCFMFTEQCREFQQLPLLYRVWEDLQIEWESVLGVFIIEPFMRGVGYLFWWYNRSQQLEEHEYYEKNRYRGFGVTLPSERA